MAKKYVAGIDAGTTGVNIVIADTDGNVVGIGYEEYPLKFPQIGWVEQDMNVMWDKICLASRQAISNSGVSPENIVSLGFSSQRGTFVGIDENWICLHDSIVWSDGRARDEVEEIREKWGADTYHEISGIPLSPNWSYAKFKWLIDKRPELVDRVWKFVNGQEWFLHKLGSEDISSDPSSLTLNGMMNIKDLDWSDELLSFINLPLEKLPTMRTPMLQVGVISREASKATGFAQGMPICKGGGDQQCAEIGAGVVREGLAEITIGTAAVMVAHIDSIRPDPYHQVIFGGSAIPHKWDMEGAVFSAGVCLRQWRDNYGAIEKDVSNRLGVDVYDLINQQAKLAPAGCKGYIFFPFIAGQGTPYWEPNARGGYIGLSLGHDRPIMIRAVMEGVAYEIRMVVEAMERVLGKRFDSIRLSGGGAKSDIWNQIQADVYGRPVEKLKVPQCTALGAAILGAVAASVFNNIEKAVDHMVHAYGLIEPNEKNHEIYNDMYEIFRSTFEALRERKIYDKVIGVQNKYWG